MSSIDSTAPFHNDLAVVTNPCRPVDHQAASSSRQTLFWLAIVLLIGAFVRLHALTRFIYVVDEAWSMEIATGQGSLHLNLQLDRLISPPPEFFAVTHAPPWWHIWTHMEVTHPPLYSILLRWWEEIFGGSDASGRLFSVLASLIAVALLFDIVRLHSGLAVAVAAGLLMALASPQVDHARLARSYALLTASALAAADAVVRIQLFGKSPRRWILLTLALLACLMTHYFCIGAILGLLIFSVCAEPKYRREIIAAFVTAGAVFAIIWAPWMWQQRHLFATDDISARFLQEQAENHIRTTITRALTNPLSMLFPQSDKGVTGILAMIGGGVLCIVALLRPIWRNNKFIGMWGLWLIGVVGVPLLLDLFRGTQHLRFLRYTILAGPAVCALLPMLLTNLSSKTLAAHLALGLIVIGCALHVQDVYDDPNVDLREAVHDLIAQPGPTDLLFVAAPPERTVIAEMQLFMNARYLGGLHCPVAVLTQPAGPEIIEAAHHARYIYLLMQDDDWQTYLPGARMIRSRRYPGVGYVFTMDLKPAM